MNIEKKFINKIIILSSLIIVVIIGITTYVYFQPKEENLGCGTESDIFICGTESTPTEKLEGKEIFNSNCAACHRMNEKSDPDLIKNIFERIPNEKYFERFINNEDSLRKANDKYAKKLVDNFPNAFIHNFKFNKEEIEDLKRYIK